MTFRFFFFFFQKLLEHLNFSISRLVRNADSDDEDNNNSYHPGGRDQRTNNHEKVSPVSELTASYKDSCIKSRSRSSSQSHYASRSCSVSPELEVDSPPPPTIRVNDSPTSTTNLLKVSLEEKIID